MDGSLFLLLFCFCWGGDALAADPGSRDGDGWKFDGFASFGNAKGKMRCHGKIKSRALRAAPMNGNVSGEARKECEKSRV
ncbi:hypothetical protein V8C35DRAFT_309110 [Trichoderma chlorosporum]